MKRHLEGILIAAATAAVMLILGLGPATFTLRAQSTKVVGRDVPPGFETWFTRVGLQNPNNGCDTALEYDSPGTARLTDCTPAANLRDLQLRGLIVNGVPTTQGAAGADVVLTKKVTAIADTVATAVLAVTVPNAAGAATIPIVLSCSEGAGGAIGAYEQTFTAYGQVVVTRTAGVAAVATATTLADTGAAHVAGGDSTGSLAYAASAISGGASAIDTFNITVTVSHGTGSATNHSCIIQADVLNANAAGITVS